MPELIDMTEDEGKAACVALSHLLRVVPVTVTEATQGEAHELRVQHQPYAA